MRKPHNAPYNIKRDRRYTVAREWCGYPEARFVARFCDKWLGQAPTEAEAYRIAQTHEDQRQADIAGLARVVLKAEA